MFIDTQCWYSKCIFQQSHPPEVIEKAYNVPATYTFLCACTIFQVYRKLLVSLFHYALWRALATLIESRAIHTWRLESLHTNEV